MRFPVTARGLSGRLLSGGFAALSLALVAAAAPGCAAEEGEDTASDDAEVVSSAALARAKVTEKSRFRHEGHASAEQDGTSALSYRFNGFGATKVKLKVSPKAGAFAPTVVLAGPIPGSENTVVLQRRGTKAGGLELEATLAAPGAYRLIVGTQSALNGKKGDAGAFELDFACTANCDIPEVTLADVLADVTKELGEDRVKSGIAQLVAAHVTDTELATKIDSQLVALVGGSVDPKAAVPVLPMSLLGVAQGLFEHAPPSSREAPPVPAKIDVELGSIGKDCKVTRGTSQQVSSAVPGLAIAEVPDYSIDDCALARLDGLAAALNALSLDNGSVVRDGAATYSTAADLVSALMKSGHHVTVDNARYYADFLGLNYKGASVRAPVWMDTGIAVPGGGTLKTPAPHAHHNFYVSGPQFDGQLKFYMGVDGGTSFRVQSNIPRHWSGGKVQYVVDGADRPDDVLLLVSTASDLRKKWQAAGASLPMQGYGRLGVCTDSTAVLEHRLRGTVTLFPLAHPKSDAAAGKSGETDAVDTALAALPSDLAGFDKDDALRRMAATIPFENVADVPFPAFVSAWQSLGR